MKKSLFKNSGFSLIEQFQAEYEDLPGQFTNGATLWGTKCATDPSNCRGSGQPFINHANSILAWKQLQLSGYIDDFIDVLDYDYDQLDCEMGRFLPETSISGVSAGFNYYTSTGGEDWYLTASVPNEFQAMVFSIPDQSAIIDEDCLMDEGTGAFSSEQLYIIDTKIDDGLAYRGEIINSQNDDGCTDSVNTDENDLDDGDYDLANSGNNLCHLFVKLKVL